MPRGKEIVVLIDGSPCSLYALAVALSLTQPEDELFCVTVVSAADVDSKRVKDSQEGIRLMIEIFNKTATKAVAYKWLALSMESRSEHDAREVLVNFVAEREADLLVCGARGVSRAHKLLLGSTSEYMVHHVHCPVVIARIPAHGADAGATSPKLVLAPPFQLWTETNARLQELTASEAAKS